MTREQADTVAALVREVERMGRYYSITGWHEDRCENRRRDIDEPCTPLCERLRSALGRAHRLIDNVHASVDK